MVQEYRDIEKLVDRDVKLTIQFQFNSAEINLRAETTAVWPTKGRARNDRNANKYTKNLNISNTNDSCICNVTFG